MGQVPRTALHAMIDWAVCAVSFARVPGSSVFISETLSRVSSRSAQVAFMYELVIVVL